MKFINRAGELRQLEEYYSLSKKRLSVVAVSGLRRVGKTTLIKEFIKNKKALYFFVYESKTSAELLREFTEELKKSKIITELETVPSWNVFFRVLFSRCGDYVIVFDEFQNFYSVDRSVFSILQRECDENSGTLINIILLGSLVGLFKKIFEDKKEPLYGRVHAKIQLKPFSFEHSMNALDILGYSDLENMLKIYGIFGGFPKYYATLEQFDLINKDCMDIIEYLFVRENAPLEDEVQEILRQEFGRRSQLYYSILHSIATGKTKLNEIASSVHMKESSITRHLRELEEKFGLVSSLKPLNVKRKTRYSINHPLIRFWFTFIYDKFSQYRMKSTDELMEQIEKGFNGFFGRRFEEICKEFLVKLNTENKLPLKIDCIGNWWGFKRIEGVRKEIEIDLVATNEKTKQVMFVESKWQEKVNALEVAKELNGKTRYVEWRNRNRTEILAVFAKSFSKKTDEFEGKPVLCYGLEDLRKMMAGAAVRAAKRGK